MTESQYNDKTPDILPLKHALREHKSSTRFARFMKIVHRPSIYPLYGRDYMQYKESFGDLMPDAETLPSNAVLVDLMGPGELYRSLQREGMTISGIAMTLTDLRNIRTRLFDFAHKNSFVTGDILDKRTWHKLGGGTG